MSQVQEEVIIDNFLETINNDLLPDAYFLELSECLLTYLLI